MIGRISSLGLSFFLQRNGQLTVGNKASLSANSTFQGTLVWPSKAAAAWKEIMSIHQSLRVGSDVWGYSPLIQV